MIKLMIKYIRTCLLLHDESFRSKAHQVYESKYNNAVTVNTVGVMTS